MDLLGSIMNSMDKPPTLTENERMLKKKRKQEQEKRDEHRKKMLKKFKEDIENKFQTYFDNPENHYIKFQPMDKIYRSIIHEVAESQGLVSYAFGTDGIDRYVRVYHKDHLPCDDEISARKRGDPWNEGIKQQLEESRRQLEEENTKALKEKPEKFVPNSNYKDKYAHLIGQNAALDAAKKTEMNKTYGFVPSENKKDLRSIEQTMADIREKKRRKIAHEENTSTSNN